MATSFFVSEEALKRIQFDDAGLLNAFDLNRELVYATAAKVYRRGHKDLPI
jgi:hypothetical protein